MGQRWWTETHLHRVRHTWWWHRDREREKISVHKMEKEITWWLDFFYVLDIEYDQGSLVDTMCMFVFDWSKINHW